MNDAYTGGIADDVAANGGENAQERSGGRLSREQLEKELADREEKLQAGGEDGMTDQYRVYQHIIQELESNRPLRLMVQASAGLYRDVRRRACVKYVQHCTTMFCVLTTILTQS